MNGLMIGDCCCYRIIGAVSATAKFCADIGYGKCHYKKKDEGSYLLTTLLTGPIVKLFALLKSASFRRTCTSNQLALFRWVNISVGGGVKLNRWSVVVMDNNAMASPVQFMSANL